MAARKVKSITEILQRQIQAKYRKSEYVLEEIRTRMHDKIITKAREKLSSSYEDYVAGLSSSIDRTTKKVKFTLTGAIPIMIETGHEPFDMKKQLLKGRQSRVIFIPRNRTGLGLAALMRSVVPFRRARQNLAAGKNVYNPRAGKQSKRWKVGAFTNLTYDAKVDASERSATGRGKARTNTGYGVFRTVKKDSPNWEHPGIKARHIMRDAVKYNKLIITQAIKHITGE